MSFLVSPGVAINEIDKTNSIPAISTSTGGYAGFFPWGPVSKVTLIDSENDLGAVFGRPTSEFSSSFLSAANFLSYSRGLYVSRAAAVESFNATANTGSARMIPNEDAFESVVLNQTDEVYARYPGSLGNSLHVEFSFAGVGSGFTTSAYDDLFNSEPGTSDGAADAGIANDEVNVVVIDAGGLFTGVPGSVLETYEGLSVLSDVKNPQGSSLFIGEIINRDSEYIYINVEGLSNTLTGDDTDLIGASSTVFLESATDLVDAIDSSVSNPAYSLTNGSDGTLNDEGPIIAALDLFTDPESVDISLLTAQTLPLTADQTGIAQTLISVVEARKDAVAFISPPLDVNDEDDVKTFFDTISSSSYAFFDSSPVYVYDKYNDKYLYIGASGDVMGLAASTDDPWISPAGVNKGQLNNVIKLKINPNQSGRDLLYKARINPLVSFPGQGTVLYGDKTALSKSSALDRINVRRLLVTLEKAIAIAARAQLFEFNDEFTRSTFRNMVTPYLRDVKGRRGLTDFFVQCDETNNTPAVIDSNRFVASVFVQPTRSINFITLNMVITRTGVDFSEVIGTTAP